MNKNNYTLNEVLNMWLNTKTNLKVQSLLNYEQLIDRYILNDIGIKKINELKKEDYVNFFNNLIIKNVSISTQKKTLYIIKTILSFSYVNNYSDNYINLSDIRFKTTSNNIYILSKQEQKVLETYLKTNINIRKLSILLCLYTGLRVGEVCGLKWSNIDFNNNSLTVERTVERIKNNISDNIYKTILIESTPKSISSYRTIPIPNFVIDLLRKYKNDSNYFLLSNTEYLYDPRLLESFYDRTLKKCNISHNKFHTLRHTFATRSIEAKMDIKTLSEILGHSSIEITLKLYVHPSYEMKKSSIENLVQFMSNF